MKTFSKMLTLLFAFSTAALFAAYDYDDTNDHHSDHHHSFTGFDASIGLGVSSLTIARDHDKGTNTGDLSYGADGVAVQAKLGANYEFNDMFVVGLEFYAQYNSAESYNRYTSTVTPYDFKRTFSLPWNLALDARIGVCPTQNSLLFVYGGPDWGYYDFHLDEDDVVTKFDGFEIGGVFGGGLQQAVTENFFIKITVDYRWYDTKSITLDDGDVHKVTPRLTTGLLMIGYQF